MYVQKTSSSSKYLDILYISYITSKSAQKKDTENLTKVFGSDWLKFESMKIGLRLQKTADTIVAKF